jgi:hypothetical protein
MQDELSEFGLNPDLIRVYGSEFGFISGSKKAKNPESGFSESGSEILVRTNSEHPSRRVVTKE